MNIYLILYVLAAAAVVIGGTMKLKEDTMSAVIFFMGGTFIFVVYGLRWFSSNNSILSQAPVPWPPQINTCPDYLTYYEVKNTAGAVTNKTCIDTVGVSNGYMTKWPTDGTIPAYSSSSSYYFTIDTTETDTAKRNTALCAKAKDAKLTWEGITNGEACS